MQRNRGKCANTLMFSLETRIPGIREDSQAPSLREPRFRLSPPSVGARKSGGPEHVPARPSRLMSASATPERPPAVLHSAQEDFPGDRELAILPSGKLYMLRLLNNCLGGHQRMTKDKICQVSMLQRNSSQEHRFIRSPDSSLHPACLQPQPVSAVECFA